MNEMQCEEVVIVVSDGHRQMYTHTHRQTHGMTGLGASGRCDKDRDRHQQDGE